MVIAKNLTKSFGTELVFKNINFSMGNNTKIGLVGKNGCGKSTLLKVIAGEEVATQGALVIENEKLGYVPQEFNFPNQLVGEYLEHILGNSWEFYKVEKLASNLNFHNFDIYQQISTLSEGQKMKLKLIEVLLADPSFLLIDEPTNHLDIDGILWFESYIKRLNKTVLMISHDRSFLNNTVDEILEIDNKDLYRFVGDYDNYKLEKFALIEKKEEEYVRFLKRKQKLEDLLARARTKNISRSGKGVQSVKKRIDREIAAASVEKYDNTKMQTVSFDTDVRSSKLMLKFEDLSKSYENKEVFSNFDLDIRGQDKIWIFGPNGAGKTTLVKIIVGEEPYNSGEMALGKNIKIGYFAQKQTSLDYDKYLFDHFVSETSCSTQEAYGALKRFMFEGDSLKKKVKVLSPGERARFAFAIFASNDYDLLILDEPTNHLDIETKEVIEQSLSEYNGTLLLVSHDRFFVESVGINKMLNLTTLEMEYV